MRKKYNKEPVLLKANNMLKLLTNQIPDFEQLNSFMAQNDILNDVRFYFFCKDISGKFLNVNDVLLNEVGLSKESDILGLTDFDLCWKEYAEGYRKIDQMVIDTNLPKMGIEKIKIADDSISEFFYFKHSLKANSKKVIGTVGLTFSLDNLSLLKTFATLSEPSLTTNFLAKIEDPKISKRQLDCLYYLVQGMTMKEIAKKLDISHRTVEKHINDIKPKLNCTSRSEMISKALTLKAIREKLNFI